jgi:RHS repeat-associated protein
VHYALATSANATDGTLLLVDYRRRFSDPVTGRWITRDPIGYFAGTLNLYEQVLSNPLKWWDPFGLDAKYLEDVCKARGSLGKDVQVVIMKTGGVRIILFHFYDNDGNLIKTIGCAENDDHCLEQVQLHGVNANVANILNKASGVAQTGAEILIRINPLGDVIEIITGEDIITGEPIGIIGYVLNSAGLLIPVAGVLDDLKDASKVGKALEEAAAKVGGEVVGEADEALRLATKSDNAAEAAGKAKKLETAGLTSASKGALAENAAADAMRRAGYTQLPSKLPGNRGIDGVFVKYGQDGRIKDIIVTESKYGDTPLKQTKTMGKQMSNEWIAANIEKMERSTDPAVRETARVLKKAWDDGQVRKKINVLGEDGKDRWHVLDPPD